MSRQPQPVTTCERSKATLHGAAVCGLAEALDAVDWAKKELSIHWSDDETGRLNRELYIATQRVVAFARIVARTCC